MLVFAICLLRQLHYGMWQVGGGALFLAQSVTAAFKLLLSWTRVTDVYRENYLRYITVLFTTISTALLSQRM